MAIENNKFLNSHKPLDKKALRFFPFIIIFFETTLYLSNDMYLPCIPLIANDLYLTQNQVQSTLIFWFMGASSLQLILGPVSDRFGRKKIVMISCIFFILSSVACALSTSLLSFLIARFIQGAAVCSLLAAYAAIHELYATKQVIKLLAIISAVTILASALGPLIGAIIIQFASWTYIFWLLAIMGICSLISIINYMPEPNHDKHPINMQLSLKYYGNIIKNKNFLLPGIGYFLLVVIEFAWIFESPFILIEVFNTSTLFYGITQTIIFSFYLVGALVTRWLLDILTIIQFIRTSLIITIGGTILLVLTALFYNHLSIVIIAMIIISLGTSMLFGPLNRLAIEACKEPMGCRTAIFSMGVSLAGVTAGWALSIMDSDGLLPLSIFMFVCIIIAAYLINKISLPKHD